MPKVAVVTDSTSFIPKEKMQGLPLHVVPAVVVWEGKPMRDGVDRTPQEFYTRLETAPEMPTTSQPSPADMQGVFEKLQGEGYDVLAVLVSSKLSGTINSAETAQEILARANEMVNPVETIYAEVSPTVGANVGPGTVGLAYPGRGVIQPFPSIRPNTLPLRHEDTKKNIELCDFGRRFQIKLHA